MRKGQIIFKEGERIEKALLVVDGRVSLRSTLGYEIVAEGGDVIGEWVLVGEAQESATALTEVEIEELEDLSFSWALLLRAFERLEKVNENFSAELSKSTDILKTVKRLRRGTWNRLDEVMRNPYYEARRMIASGDYENAFRTLMKVDRYSSDPSVVEDSEIWKTFCAVMMGQENAIRRYNTLLRKKGDYGRYISMSVLIEAVNKGLEGMDVMAKMYLKHGILIPPKTILMLEGERGREAFFVLRGSPRVVRYSGGEEKILAFLGPGELVGEVAVLGDVPRTATVFTSVPLQVLVFEKEVLKGVVEDNEKFGLEVLRGFLRRIARMRKLKEAGADPIKRIKALFADRTVEEVNEMGITLDEMASYLGMDKKRAVDFLTSNRIASIRSDGRLKFTGELV